MIYWGERIVAGWGVVACLLGSEAVMQSNGSELIRSIRGPEGVGRVVGCGTVGSNEPHLQGQS
jgi:hypothetical protein